MEQKELSKLTEREKQKIRYVINDLLYKDIPEEPTEYDVLMNKKIEDFTDVLCKENDPSQIEDLLKMCNEYIFNVSFAGTGFGIIMMYDMWLNECAFWPTNNPKLWKKWEKLKKKKVSKSVVNSLGKNGNETNNSIKTMFNSEDIINNRAWIAPRGHIFGVPTTHITTVIENPDLFGLSKEKVKVIFDRHGNDIESENRAKNEIITLLVLKSWICINYLPEFCKYEIELDSLDDIHREYLSIWASKVLNKHHDRANCQVTAHEKLPNDHETTLEINDLINKGGKNTDKSDLTKLLTNDICLFYPYYRRH